MRCDDHRSFSPDHEPGDGHLEEAGFEEWSQDLDSVPVCSLDSNRNPERDGDDARLVGEHRRGDAVDAADLDHPIRATAPNLDGAGAMEGARDDRVARDRGTLPAPRLTGRRLPAAEWRVDRYFQ